jgi:flagellar hook assembly protein FlgD
MLGQRVKTLVNDSQQAGTYTVTWNATDVNNVSVASGVYIYKLQAGSSTLMRKMVLIR